MKYSIIFAATAAASYDAYGNKAYGEEHKASSTPCSTAQPTGYTTIYPGYDKHPVTVTKQHQPYPTCVSAGYDSKSCGKWEEDMYVSTTIKDYDGHYKVITKTDEPVTVYHEKKTITHSATGKYGYPTSAAGYAKPTGSAYNKNGTDGCWYELYEKVEEVPYKQLGPHALPGYSGSGLYPEGEKEQPVKVKEYKGGKWSEYEHVYRYGKPEEEVKTYDKGVHTIPAKDVYVDKSYDYAAEATTTAKAGETCVYGGKYVDAKETGHMTVPYAAYETHYVSGKPVTETVVKYTTIYVTKTGKVEVAKPTTTVYEKDHEVVYPTAKHVDAGYYHQDAKTITVTKSGDSYTCTYEKKDYPTPSAKKDYPAYPTKTPSHDDSYGYYKPSATPKKPSEEEHKYPQYPSGQYNGTHEYKPNYSPVAVTSKPYEAYPVKATSTPCESDKYPVATSSAHVEYPAYPEASKPAKHEEYPAYPEASKPAKHDEEYPAYPEASKPAKHGEEYPAYPEASKPAKHGEEYPAYPATPVIPAKASSTPCDDDKKPQPTPYKPAGGEYDAYHPEPAKSTPAYNAYPAATPAHQDSYGAGYKRSRIARAL